MKNITVDKKIAKAVVLFMEPLEGYTPDDIRQWLIEHITDDDLATAYAQVSNQAGWLMHDVGDPDNDEETDRKIRQCFDAWWELDQELLSKIIDRIKCYNRDNGTNYPIEGKGTHFIVEPFMNMHGYRDGSGWWINKD